MNGFARKRVDDHVIGLQQTLLVDDVESSGERLAFSLKLPLHLLDGFTENGGKLLGFVNEGEKNRRLGAHV
jgi:hypothetical protein